MSIAAAMVAWALALSSHEHTLLLLALAGAASLPALAGRNSDIIRWMWIPPREFERLVEEALTDLPPQFAELLENVAVVVEEEPSPDDREALEEPDHELLGIYRGVALTRRTHDMLPMLPDQIAIFRGPINRIARTRREAMLEIRDTVIHELGHYFGLHDHEMPY